MNMISMFLFFIQISKDLRKRLYQRRQKKPRELSRSPSGGRRSHSRSRSRGQDRRK